MKLNSRLKTIERAVISEDGTGLHVSSCGDPADPPVLLLHGGGQTGWSWRSTALKLASSGWYCLLPDLRGHGQSDFASSYELERFAEDVAGLTTALCTQPPVLVGASMGGLSGLMAQAQFTNLRALVLVDIVPDWESRGIDQILAFLGANPDGFASLEAAAQAVADYLPHRDTPPSPNGLRKNLRQQNGRWFWHWDPSLLEAANEHVARWQSSVSRACRDIYIPTLLISGSRSEVVSAAGAAKLTQLIPHAKHVVIEDAHHMVAGDSNQHFTNAVIQFLNTLDNPDLAQEDSLCLLS